MQALKNADKKKKHSSLKVDALRWFSNIQIHGAKILTDKESSWYWIPSMLLLLTCASSLVYMTVSRYHEHPTFLLQLETGHIVLPFPSVLICPEVGFRTYKKNEFLSSINYPEGFNKTYVRAILPQLAAFFSLDVIFKVKDLQNLERLLKFNNIDVESAGRWLTASCEEILLRCRWNNIYMNCSNIFSMELTGDGFCCTFNGRSLRRETMEKGKGNLARKVPVWQTRWFGYTGGLMVAVSQRQRPFQVDLAYKWIALYTGGHFVDTSVNGTPLNPGSEQWLGQYVRSFHIDESARYLSNDLKQCKLKTEDLEYFPVYRRKYCFLECEIKNTIRLCNCVRIVHPKPPGVPYCNADQLECASHATVSKSNANDCQCLPTCDVNTFIIKRSTFNLDPAVEPLDSFYEGLNYNKVTVLRIFLQKRVKNDKQRLSYYTYVELFGQVGGMFNAFFGCSILTILGIIQLLWRITVILWCKLLAKMSRRIIANN